MPKPSAVNIEIKTLVPFVLADVLPEIKEGIVVGYKYQVTLPKHKYDKFNVKILGEQLIEVTSEDMQVEFENLIVHPYVIDNKFGLTGTATGIKQVTKASNSK